ncbi:MAG: T9SS type A sorting domain-containing protein [Crocinitomicaceae bacterium]|nr:T9SS type A sorting domain-containing protein [Crocinitomicaceae bacterium]
MKYFLSIFFVLALRSTGISQNYRAFPDSNSVWVNVYEDLITTPFFHCEFSYSRNICMGAEDTLINSLQYSKLDTCVTGGYIGAVRDNGGQVFFVPRDSLNESLLFDFTLSAGDSVYQVYNKGWYENFYVESIDSILIYGDYRTTIHFSTGGFWIEGIGNHLGMLESTYEFLSNSCFYLNCMNQNDTIFYPNQSFGNCQTDLGIVSNDFDFDLFPNPSSDGTFKIQSGSPIEKLTYKIFTPNGKIVQEGKLESNQIDLKSDSGLYFIQVSDGKGIVTRRIIVN